MEEDELEMPRQVYFQKLRIQNIMTGRNKQRTEGDNEYIKTVSSTMTGDDLMEKLGTMDETLEKLKIVYGRISKSYKPTNSHEKMTKDEFETWMESLSNQMQYFMEHIKVSRPKKRKEKRGKNVIQGKKKKFKSEIGEKRSPLTQRGSNVDRRDHDDEDEEEEDLQTTLSLTRNYHRGDGCKNCLTLVDRIEKMQLVMDGYTQREAMLKRQSTQLQRQIETSKKKVIATVNNKDYTFVYTEQTQKHIEDINKMKFEGIQNDLNQVAKTKQKDMFKSLKEEYQQQLKKVNQRIERHRKDYGDIVHKIQCMNKRFALYSRIHQFQKEQLATSTIFHNLLKREPSGTHHVIKEALEENKIAQDQLEEEEEEKVEEDGEDPIMGQTFGQPPLEGKMVVLVHSIQGATVLWDLLPQEMLEAMTLYYNTCMTVLQQYGGYLIDLDADAHWVTFSKVSASLEYIKTLQTEMLKVDWPEKLLRHPLAEVKYSNGKDILFKGLRIRMSVHYDDVAVTLDHEKRELTYDNASIARCKLIEKFATGGDVIISNDYWNIIKPLLNPNSIVSSRFDAMNIKPNDAMKTPMTPITPRGEESEENLDVTFHEFTVSSLGTKTLDAMGTREKLRRLGLVKLKKRSHNMLQRSMSKVFLPVDQDERSLNHQIKALLAQQYDLSRYMHSQKMEIRYKMEIDALNMLMAKKEEYIHYLLDQIPKNPDSNALPASLTNQINKHLDSMLKHKKVSTRNQLILDHLSDRMKTDIGHLQKEIDKVNHVFVTFPEFRKLEGADRERRLVRAENEHEIQYLEAKDTITTLRRDVKKYKRTIKKLEEDLEELEVDEANASNQAAGPSTSNPTKKKQPTTTKHKPSPMKKKKKRHKKKTKKKVDTPSTATSSVRLKLPKINKRM